MTLLPPFPLVSVQLGGHIEEFLNWDSIHTPTSNNQDESYQRALDEAVEVELPDEALNFRYQSRIRHNTINLQRYEKVFSC